MMIYCKECKQDTEHKVVKKYEYEYTPENTPKMQIDFVRVSWMILQCKGCKDITARESWRTSEDWPEETVILYPKRGQDDLTIKSFYNVPEDLEEIYEEIINCYNNKIYVLCAAGLRGIIEGICAKKNIKSGNVVKKDNNGSQKTKREKTLEGKIEGLHEKGFLTKEHSEILHEHRSLGNEAVHELGKPSKKELELAIQIIEHTLENIYELKGKADKLRQVKKRRNKKYSK